MSEAGFDAENKTFQVDGKLTRRPGGRRRRFELITRTRMKNLGAPFEAPGAELAELPGVGVVVIAVLAVIALIVVGVLLGGFLVALVELIILAALAAMGSLWAWLRGHPKIAVIDVGNQRWRRDTPMIGIAEDVQAIAEGANPANLGYHQIH